MNNHHIQRWMISSFEFFALLLLGGRRIDFFSSWWVGVDFGDPEHPFIWMWIPSYILCMYLYRYGYVFIMKFCCMPGGAVTLLEFGTGLSIHAQPDGLSSCPKVLCHAALCSILPWSSFDFQVFEFSARIVSWAICVQYLQHSLVSEYHSAISYYKS